MQMRSKLAMTVLLPLLGIGFWGALSVSYTNLTGAQNCPHLAGIAICYVVAIAYGSMLVSLLLKRSAHHYTIFSVAWGITFLIALSGSGLELSQGGVCPITSFQLPLCYVSLALCLAIMASYLAARPAKV
jgi:hypothetical protein